MAHTQTRTDAKTATPSGRFGNLRLGSIAGVEIFADWSLAIIVLLIAVTLGAGVFPTWHPDWSAPLVWTTALAAALLFIASVLLHELSHALVGRTQGMPIRRITLFVFGGMAHLDREPESWHAEFKMAIVGPIVSVALGLAMIFASSLLAGRIDIGSDDPADTLRALGPVATVLLWLGPINLLLAAFNLLPGFPLDGGRVLRAVVWGITGDLLRATRWAAASGRAFGWLLIAIGFAMLFGLRIPLLGGGALTGVWVAVIGWFLSMAATASYGRLLVQRSLAGVPVSRLMLAPAASVLPDTFVGRLIDDYIMRFDQRAFPVTDGDNLIGLVTLDDVRRMDANGRDTRTVRDIMTPLAQLVTIAPDADSAIALEKLSRHAVNQLPVVENRKLRGLVRREDLLKWLALHNGPSHRRGAG